MGMYTELILKCSIKKDCPDDELKLRSNLKHPSAYLDIDEYGEDALLDGRFTLSELQQIAVLMEHRQNQYKELTRDLP